jgi:hypothetical protein
MGRLYTNAQQAALYFARKRRRQLIVDRNTPVGYWPLTAASISGTSASGVPGETDGWFDSPIYNGILNGSPTSSDDGVSLAFNGSQYVQTPLAWPRSGAVALWVNPGSNGGFNGPAGWKDGANGYVLIDTGGGGNSWRWVFNPAGTGEQDVSMGGSFSNDWQMLAAIWQETSPNIWNFSFFVNNEIIGTGNYNGGPSTIPDSSTFCLGTTGVAANNDFVGSISQVSMFGNGIPDSYILDTIYSDGQG